MPPTYFFVLDVTAGAVSSGMLAVACETIRGALDALPGGERTLVGFLTLDAHLQFYRLSALQGSAHVSAPAATAQMCTANLSTPQLDGASIQPI